jgi:arylsulfatase A-like enzyme
MYQRIAERATRAVANPENDFVYAHVSVPHGPNIWSSASQDFTFFNLRKDGYFENLELADRLLGELRRALEGAGLWETTTVVATADHGWRHVDLIGERRDHRVPLLVKFPGQHARFDVSETVDAATTVKRIVLGALSGEISSPAELQAKLAGEWRMLAAASHSR